MKYLSCFDGIGAAHEASKELKWTCVGASEIAAFPIAVVKERHPEVQHLGDITKYHEWKIERPDLICGGSPCQAFSVAGLRAGLADPRGNLALVFLGLIDHHRPKWVVFENVPGIYSSTSHNAPDPDPPGLPLDVVRDHDVVEPDAYDADEDHAFACFLAGLQELGYGVQYRTFDAQYFGVAQRRNRVFVVGYLGDWRPATAVLLEPEGMSGNPPPRRAPGKRPAPTLASRTRGGGGLGTDFDLDGGLIQSTVPDVSSPLRSGSDSEAAHGKVNGTDRTTLIPEVASPITVGNSVSGGGAMPGSSVDGAGGLLIPEVTGPLVTRSTPKGHGAAGVNDQEVFSGHLIPEVANPLTARMHKGVNTTMDEGQTMVPVAFKMRGGGNGTGERGGAVGTQGGVGYLGQEECAFTLSTTEDQHVAVPFAFKPAHFTRDKDGAPADIAPPLSCEADKGDQEAVVCVPWDITGVPEIGGAAFAGAKQTDVHTPLRAQPPGTSQGSTTTAIQVGMAVRRLTPRECERLQGFPDDYTLIPWRGKPAELCPDGPRYKALGNSWAVPNMRWIFRRIQKVDDILKRLANATV